MKITKRKFLAGASLLAASSLLPYSIRPLTAEEKLNKNNSSIKKVQTWCEMCFWGCGTTAILNGDRVQKLEGQKNCPNNWGALCARGNAGQYVLYDPDRIKGPLIRVGDRGEGNFKQVSWDEALDYVAQKLKDIISKYGSKSVAWAGHGTGKYAWKELMHIIHSPNSASPSFSQCLGSREVAWNLTYGSPFAESYDAEFSKCMMFIGRNILESLQVGETKRVIDSLSSGAKLIYVDPRYTKTAAKADIYMKIRPGTDMALVLSMINYMIENNLYDKQFVTQYTSGFKELSEHVKKYTLEWGSKETEIPASLIIEACEELYKAAPHCFIHPGRRTTRYGNDTQLSRAIAIMNALLGNIYMPGGIFKAGAFGDKPPSMCGYSGKEDAKKEDQRADGAGSTYPFTPGELGLTNKLLDAIATQKPYPVKALFGYCSSIFNYASDFEYLKKIIQNLDLLVTCDIYMTEMSLYSDVVLPESTYLERQDPIQTVSGKTPYVRIREQAVKPLYDTLGAWDIVTRLCKKMDKNFWFKSIDDFNKSFCESNGIDLEKLKKEGVILKETDPYPRYTKDEIHFDTPSGKVELLSSKLAEKGFEPLPVYKPLTHPKEDEFRMLFGRESHHTHARTQNIKPLMALNNYRCNVWIPKSKADKLGIKDGDKIRIVKGDKKSNICFAHVTEEIHDEAIFIPHGYGRFSKFMKTAFQAKGASDVDFCSNDTDPISGCAAFHNAFVKIEKV
jgi:thiosulfate reductase/polysulfide reductase chain A